MVCSGGVASEKENNSPDLQIPCELNKKKIIADIQIQA